jgi:hypothetical protein
LTVPTRRAPYLHIDEFTLELPRGTDPGEVLQQLEQATANRVALAIKVVDNDGDNIGALVIPASARIITISESQLPPRKTRPSGT